MEDPAALHAAIGLGLAHKKDGFRSSSGGSGPSKSEKLALHHYNLAIRHLQPHLVSREPASVRITMTVCLMFTCMEFILGHYLTGQQHLQNGMRLIGDLICTDSVIDLDVTWDPDDSSLAEAVGTMNLHSALMGIGKSGVYKMKQNFDDYPLPVMFRSMAQARKRLDWIVNEMVKLSQQRRVDPAMRNDWAARKQSMQTQLVAWDRVFKVSRASLVAQMGFGGPFAYRIMRLFYTMAHIMVDTFLDPEGELAYDRHTDAFLSIINNAISFHEAIFAAEMKDTALEHIQGAGYFTTDRGWIIPLYFTAIKCRVPRIRQQAIQMLRYTVSREGIWDAGVVATVAEEVAKQEDDDAVIEGAFGPLSIITADALTLPTVTEAARLSDVRIIPPNGADDNMRMLCHRHNGREMEFLVREHDGVSKEWITVDF